MSRKQPDAAFFVDNCELSEGAFTDLYAEITIALNE